MNENNLNVEKKSNKSKLLILVAIVFVVVAIVYLVINKDKIFVKQKFDIVGSEKMFTIGSVQEIDDDNDYIYRVELTMNNNTKYDIAMNQYLFQVVNELKLPIGACYGDALAEEKRNDMFPSVAPASTVTKGYLYCFSSIEDNKQLRLTYVSSSKIDDNGKVSVDTKEFYYDLK